MKILSSICWRWTKLNWKWNHCKTLHQQFSVIDHTFDYSLKSNTWNIQIWFAGFPFLTEWRLSIVVKVGSIQGVGSSSSEGIWIKLTRSATIKLAMNWDYHTIKYMAKDSFRIGQESFKKSFFVFKNYIINPIHVWLLYLNKSKNYDSNRIYFVIIQW